MATIKEMSKVYIAVRNYFFKHHPECVEKIGDKLYKYSFCGYIADEVGGNCLNRMSKKHFLRVIDPSGKEKKFYDYYERDKYIYDIIFNS